MSDKESFSFYEKNQIFMKQKCYSEKKSTISNLGALFFSLFFFPYIFVKAYSKSTATEHSGTNTCKSIPSITLTL